MSNDIEEEINNIENSKKGIFRNIAPQSLKEAADICSPLLCNMWAKEILQKGTFPKDLKNADGTTVFKKDNPLLAKNYRPARLLPTVFKIFERIMHGKIIDFVNQCLSALLC